MRLAPANRYPTLRNIGLTIALGVAASELAGCGVADPTNKTVEVKPVPAVLQAHGGTWKGKLVGDGTEVILDGETNVDVNCFKTGAVYEVTIEHGLHSGDRIDVARRDLRSVQLYAVDGLRPRPKQPQKHGGGNGGGPARLVTGCPAGR